MECHLPRVASQHWTPAKSSGLLPLLQAWHILIWVDDALKVDTSDMAAWLEAEFDSEFKGSHTPETKMFVGVEIIRDHAARTFPPD